MDRSFEHTDNPLDYTPGLDGGSHGIASPANISPAQHSYAGHTPSSIESTAKPAKQKVNFNVGTSGKAIGKFLTYTIVIAASFCGMFYILMYQPRFFDELLLQVDRMGVTPIGENEKKRIAEINTLPITYEEKQVLLNRTVFLGATMPMVVLALGEPNAGKRVNGNPDEDIVLVYQFKDDARPTLLTFKDGKLTQAAKGSALDMASPSNTPN